MTYCRRCQNRLTPEEANSAWPHRCTACRPAGPRSALVTPRQCSACGADLGKYALASVSVCDPCFRLTRQRFTDRYRRKMLV